MSPALDRAARMLAALLAGLLVYAAVPPLGLWWCAPAGIGLTWAAMLRWGAIPGPGARLGAVLGLLQGLATYLLLLPWVGEFVGAAPYLALAGLLAVLWGGLRGLALAVLARTWPLRGAWLAPFAWVAVEAALARWPFGGFGWVRLAWGQVDGPLAGLARWGGPPLVSWAVAAVGVLSVTLLRMLWFRWRRHARWTRAGRRQTVAAAVALVLVALAVGVAERQVAIAAAAPADRMVRVAAVQGNVPRLGLDFAAQRMAVLGNHVRVTHRIPRGSVDLVVWPENSSDISPFRDPEALRLIQRAARDVDAPILVGTLGEVRGETRNTMVVVNPDGTVGDRHDKRFLQPFGETMPMRDLLRRISPLVDRAGDFRPGHDDGVVRIGGVPLGVATCYEVAFEPAYRDAVRGGAQLMATPTNNATFGFTDMTWQQLAMSRLRAVETDRAVVVAATSGVSAIIGADGGVRENTGIFEPGVLTAELPLRTGLTPAVRGGFPVECILVIIGAAGVIAAALLPGRRRAPRRAVRL